MIIKVKPIEKEENETKAETFNLRESLSRRWPKIKACFVEWSLASTYHCYPKIFRPNTNRLLQIFWLITFLSCSCLTVIVVLNCIASYYEYNIVSTVELIDEAPTNFPTVTLCDANSFTTLDAQKLLTEITLKFFGTDIHNDSFYEAFFKTFVSTTVAKIVTSLDNYSDEKRKALGFNLNETLFFCFFNGNFCNASEFTWMYSYEDGNCFQFNKHAPLKQITQGFS